MKLFLATAIPNKLTITNDYWKQSSFNLESFWYLKKKRDEDDIRFMLSKGQDNFMLDSVAFSMFKLGIDKHKLLKYVDDYCDFINYFKIKNFLELDIDVVIGYESVKKLNDYIKNKTDVKPIYVHHTNRPYEDYINACKNNKLVAVGGLVGEKNDYDLLNTFIEDAYVYGTKVHLLGWSPINGIEKLKHLYSSDSTSYSMGGRSGIAYNFINDKMTQSLYKDKERVLYYKINDHNLRQWIKYQAFLKDKCWVI